MVIEFFKYQGTGNDFIIIDNRSNVFDRDNVGFVAEICDRRFGIGADGLMLLQEAEGYDFEMLYYNSDGSTSTMCGNGGRCLVAFANKLGLAAGQKGVFLAVDGPHEYQLKEDLVSLKMIDVKSWEAVGSDYFLHTGSPHYVSFCQDVILQDVERLGRAVRYNDRFKEQGTNVNYCEFDDGRLVVRTYERGVESETLSCGTGVTAAALVFGLSHPEMNIIPVSTKGGNLQVSFERKSEGFDNVWLTGPATFVYRGFIDIPS